MLEFHILSYSELSVVKLFVNAHNGFFFVSAVSSLCFSFFVCMWGRMDQEFYRRHSVTEMKEDSSKTLSAAARRSFFRRKQKHKRSSSKDSKEMVALDAISTDSIPLLDGANKA